jgi:Predicted hydrolase of the alpha/beta superfamily
MSQGHQSKNFFLQGPVGKLEAVLWAPTSDTPPKSAALVCHPHPLFGGTLHNKVVYQAAKALDGLGMPVLRFNFRGAGMSEGHHDRGRGELDDVRSALAFLAKEFRGAPLLLAGFSFGCWVGLRAGCQDARVEKLIGIGAPVNNSDFSYLRNCSKPKLFVHGSNDEHGDVNKVREMVASLSGENELAVIEGVDHFFSGKIDALGAAITGWAGAVGSTETSLGVE